MCITSYSCAYIYQAKFIDLNCYSHYQDKGLRELASSALSVLVKYDPDYSANFILEKVIPCTLSSDLCMRHGATLAAGELVLALHKCGYILSTGSGHSLALSNMPEFV